MVSLSAEGNFGERIQQKALHRMNINGTVSRRSYSRYLTCQYVRGWLTKAATIQLPLR